MFAAIGSCLLLLAASAGAVRLEGQVGAGGGYQGNVTMAAAGSPTSGSGLGAAWAALGAGWDPAEETYLYGGLRYDGGIYPGATDLNRNAGGVDLMWLQAFGDPFAIIVGASSAWVWYADSARSGPGVSARATLRVKPWGWLALRSGYAYAQRWAEDDAYSTSSNSIFASAEARVARGVYLGLAYAWLTGPQTFYASVPVAVNARANANGPGGGGAGPGSGGGTPTGSGVFSDLAPYLAEATENTLTPTFEATVWEGLYLLASYSYTWGASSEGSYTVQYAFGGAGYRF